MHTHVPAVDKYGRMHRDAGKDDASDFCLSLVFVTRLWFLSKHFKTISGVVSGKPVPAHFISSILWRSGILDTARGWHGSLPLMSPFVYRPRICRLE